MPILKKLAARLPDRWQNELKRLYFARQIKNDKFYTNEPEYRRLQDFIQPGDWVIDIGANVGHYTKRLSELAGPQGRVIAFEPIPVTFSLLSSNVQLFPDANVSLINAAVSDRLDMVGMSFPEFTTGLKNYYEAHLLSSGEGALSVLTVPLDSLSIERKVALVKIDTEGHEASVLAGMRRLIEASHPVLIVETGSSEVIADLEKMGYTSKRLEKSPNVLFTPEANIQNKVTDLFFDN